MMLRASQSPTERPSLLAAAVACSRVSNGTSRMLQEEEGACFMSPPHREGIAAAQVPLRQMLPPPKVGRYCSPVSVNVALAMPLMRTESLRVLTTPRASGAEGAHEGGDGVRDICADVFRRGIWGYVPEAAAMNAREAQLAELL